MYREGEAIGFVKLREQMTGTYEIVYAIGDEALWGQGYGTDAVPVRVSYGISEMAGRQGHSKNLPGKTYALSVRPAPAASAARKGESGCTALRLP